MGGLLKLVLLALLSTDPVFVNSNLQNSQTDDEHDDDVVAENLVHSEAAADPATDSSECLTALKNNLYRPHNLSSQYWDATGWPSPGVLQGNFVWLGRYEDCQRIKDGRYCLAQAEAKLPPPWSENASSVQISWGICAVKTCNDTIIEENIKDIFHGAIGFDDFEVMQSSVHCQQPSRKSTGFYAAIGICAVLGFFCLIGSLVDLKHRYKLSHHPMVFHRMDNTGPHFVSVQSLASQSSNQAQDGQGDGQSTGGPAAPDRDHLIKALHLNSGLFTKFWRCFSIVHHLENLFQFDADANSPKSKLLPCLDGLRVLSILWIMLGHTYLGAFVSGIMDNPLDALKLPKHLAWQFIGNAYFAVDTFFLLSGFLVAYLTLPVLRQRDGKFPIFKYYIFRYFRLTPVVGFIMLLWMFVLPHVSEGPLWFNLQNDHLCEKYWWPNLLYIQNFYPVSLQNVCIGWVWYLALDTQFYVISPLILYVLHKSVKKGFVLILFLAAASLLVTATLIGYYKIDINLTLSVLNGDMQAMEDYESIIYGKPYCRIVPYLVGIALGYKIHSEGNNKRYISNAIIALGWLLSLVAMVAILLAFYWTFFGRPFTLAGNVLYGTFSHLIWAVAVAWVIYACRHGYAGFLNNFLSWHWWRPLSKLTFSVYMFHALVMFTFNFSQKSTFHMDTYHMIMRYGGFLVLSFLGALGIHVAVEMPFIHLLRFFSASPR